LREIDRSGETMRIISIVLCLIALAGAGAATAQTQATADTPISLSNATFTQPMAWTAKGDPTAMVLTPPEKDLELTFVDVPNATGADSAVAAAWSRQYPGFARELEVSVPGAAREGWEEQKSFKYRTSPAEHQEVRALAFRKGSKWTVLLIQGSVATFEKRGGTLALALASLRPAGYARESFAGRTPHPLDAKSIEALKQFLSASMQQLDVAGVSFALLDHGHLVYAGGLGVKELGKPDKVDGDTLFRIASNTKGMSTLMLAKLVDEGRFSWNDKVTKVYPSFRLGSDTTTASVEMRHLVCACTGLPRRDFPDILSGTSLTTPASLTFEHLAQTEPTSKFGETFQYNNLMAAAAGYIGGHIAHPELEIGAAYDKTMQEKVFKPLGMKSTTLSLHKALAGNHASGHAADIDGHLSLALVQVNDAFNFERPAGAAWSSAVDVIKYVDNELREGVLPTGERYMTAANLLARRQPNVPLGEDGFYGMGLMGQKTADVQWYHHGGDLIGYHSDLYFIPGAQVGAVLLTNTDSGAAMRGPFIRRLLELLYDGKPEAEETVKASAAAIKAAVIAERKQLVYPADPKIASGLASRYTSEDLGSMGFTRSPRGLSGSNGVWSINFATKANPDGTVSLVTASPGLTGLEFVVANEGGKRALVVRDGQHVYRYTETP
jgi:CubicO group peptidase (beta-lactamase class C family)